MTFATASDGWAVGGSGTIVATTDGGRHWKLQGAGVTSQYLSGIAFRDALHGYAVGNLGTILRTSNGGKTWTLASSPTTVGLGAVAATATGRACAVGRGGISLLTTNGGGTWTRHGGQGPTGELDEVTFPDALDGWTTGDEANVVLHTANGGAVWTAQTVDAAAELWGVHFCDAQHGWAVGALGQIYGTTDGGQSWQRQGAGTTMQALEGVATIDAQHAWATGEGGTIVATTDGGKTWQAQDPHLPAGYSTDVVYKVAFASDEVGWAVGFNDAAGNRDGVILGTTDGGATWAAQYQTDNDELYAVACAGASDAWVVSATSGIRAPHDDGGTTWTHEQPRGAQRRRARRRFRARRAPRLGDHLAAQVAASSPRPTAASPGPHRTWGRGSRCTASPAPTRPTPGSPAKTAVSSRRPPAARATRRGRRHWRCAPSRSSAIAAAACATG